jgi:hypothetical protein
MNIRHIISLISSILFVVAGLWYVIDIAKSKVKPNVASFVVYSFTNASLFASLIVKHVWVAVPLGGISTLSSLAVVALCFRTKYFHFSLADKIAFGAGLVGLVLWVVTKNASYNVYILAVLNTVVFAPITIKALKHPDLETVLPWRLNLVASLFLVLAVPSFTLLQLVIPIQQLVCSGPLNLALMRGEILSRRQRLKQS